MAAKTWSRTVGDANWSTAANWSGGTVPATTDDITFDATSVLDCTIDNLGTFSGGTFTVATTYVGQITQNVAMVTAAFVMNGNNATAYTMSANLTTTSFAVTTGVLADGFTATTGAFQCTTFAVSSGYVNLGATTSCISTGAVSFSTAAGTPTVAITCPTGTWETRAGWSQAGSDLVTFIANGGTISFAGASAQTINVPSITFNLCTIPNKTNTLTVSAGTTVPLGASPSSTATTITNNGTITFSGTWNLGGTIISLGAGSTTTGSSTPRVVTGGDVTINATATVTSSIPFDFTPTTARQDITASSYTFGTCTVNAVGNIAFRIVANTTVPLGSNPSTDTGTALFEVLGIVTLSGTWTHIGAITVGTGGEASGGFTAVSLDNSFTVQTFVTFPSSITLTITGTGNCSLSVLSGSLGSVILNRNTGSVSTFTVGTGFAVPLGTNPTVNLGSGAVTWSGNFSATGTIAYTGGAVTFGASTVITGTFTWKQLTPVSFTLNAATTWPSTGGVWFDVTSANTRTLAGAGKTFASFQRTGSNAAEIIITGTNTFTTFTDNDGLVAHTLTFPNVTTTVGTFDVAGSVGKLVTLQRTGGAGTFTLTKSTAGAVNTVDYISVSNSTVDASPKWYAGSNSTDGTGNTNWIFGDEPAAKTRKQAILL